jgi:hypothetical protein
MNFNFQEFRSPRRQRLFIPLSGFSFANFIVPIKFRQPAFAGARLLSSPPNTRMFRNDYRARRMDSAPN